MIIPILTRRSYDFSLTSGTAFSIVLVRYLDVIAYRSATLLTRVHAMNVFSGRLSVLVYRTSPSPDAPEDEFVGATTIASTQIQGEVANSLVRQTLTTPLGSHVRVELVPDPAASPGMLTATLSMVMILREQP